MRNEIEISDRGRENADRVSAIIAEINRGRPSRPRAEERRDPRIGPSLDEEE